MADRKKSWWPRFDLKALLILPVLLSVPITVARAGPSSAFTQTFFTMMAILCSFGVGGLLVLWPQVAIDCYKSSGRKYLVLLICVSMVLFLVPWLIWRCNEEVRWTGHSTTTIGILAGWSFPFAQAAALLLGAWFTITRTLKDLK